MHSRIRMLDACGKTDAEKQIAGKVTYLRLKTIRIGEGGFFTIRGEISMKIIIHRYFFFFNDLIQIKMVKNIEVIIIINKDCELSKKVLTCVQIYKTKIVV